MASSQETRTDNRKWVAPGIVERVEESWRLVGSRCETCHAHVFPPASVCPICAGTELTNVHLPPTGRLYSVTTVTMAPPGFEAPYRLGWVDFDDDVRAFGQIVPADGPEPPIGAAVEVTVAVIRKEPDGTPVHGHAFSRV